MSGPLQFVAGLGMVPVNQVAGAGDELQPGAASELPPPPPAPVVTHAPARAPAKAPKADKPINVLALARARLKVVEREIKLRDKLTVERDELRRLIAAARPTTKRREAAH